jgi:hypothetical protein
MTQKKREVQDKSDVAKGCFINLDQTNMGVHCTILSISL